jgi:hypothetical protein
VSVCVCVSLGVIRCNNNVRAYMMPTKLLLGRDIETYNYNGDCA